MFSSCIPRFGGITGENDNKPKALVPVLLSTSSRTASDSWDSSSNDTDSTDSTPTPMVDNAEEQSTSVGEEEKDGKEKKAAVVGKAIKHDHDDISSTTSTGSISNHLSSISITTDRIIITSDTNQNKKLRLSLSEETVNTLMIDTKTHFPHFLDLDELELLSDDELSDYDSDDEHDDEHDDLLECIEKKYSNQEEQDVEVFSRIANRMDLTSLLHILQGNVHENEAKVEQQAQQVPSTPSPIVVEKNFRWAMKENSTNEDEVHVVVNEIESWKHKRELWWNAYEFNMIRGELIKTISIYTKHREDYIDSLRIVYKGLEPTDIIEEKMKQISKESHGVRGLESHMVSFVKDKRTKHRREVLRQQKVCNTRGDNFDKFCDCLYKQSSLHTPMFITFAQRMGQCDEIESLLVLNSDKQQQ